MCANHIQYSRFCYRIYPYFLPKHNTLCCTLRCPSRWIGCINDRARQVSHPLLPSQAVHGPISKLIAAASSYGGRKAVGGVQDAAGGVTALVQEERTDVTQAAVEETQTNLARLLGAIWRKLREESALLDFFLQTADRRVTARESTPWGVGRPASAFMNEEDRLIGNDGSHLSEIARVFRLDVFSSLLPLLELPGRAGLHAREACLVALSVKDSRISTFVDGRTQFCTQLSRSLTARYLALYDTLEELQAAAASVLKREEVAAAGELAAGSATVQLTEAEGTFSECLALFLQHLKFCNAVGLVAAGSRAACRPPARCCPLSSGHGGNGLGSRESAATTTESHDSDTDCAEHGDVASSLAFQVRHLLLGEAIGPALSSALESRAGIAQAVAARMITELSTGVEEYGIAVAGIAARVGEDGCRRQLGPLLDEASTFLIGREGSWATGDHEKAGQEEESNPDTEEGSPSSSSSSCYDNGSSSRVTVRDILLRRVASSSPALRVSTLGLVASLAELRYDRVFLDLIACSESASPGGVTASERAGEGGLLTVTLLEHEDGMCALLEPAGPLEDLRVTRAMVDSFGSAFVGSPIHPNFRRFASHVSLERYLVQAHQRQIQQLMMEARVSHSKQPDEDMELETESGVAVGVNGNGQSSGSVRGVAGGPAVVGRDVEAGEVEAAVRGMSHGDGERSVDVFDAEGFVRQYGKTLAVSVDAPGSFLHVLFDCLEVGVGEFA